MTHAKNTSKMFLVCVANLSQERETNNTGVHVQAFTSWQAHTAHKLQREEKLGRAVARLQHCLVARAFSTWAGHTRRSADLQQRLAKAVSAFQNGAMHAAFNAWLDSTQQLRESRAQVLQSTCMLNNPHPDM